MSLAILQKRILSLQEQVQHKIDVNTPVTFITFWGNEEIPEKWKNCKRIVTEWPHSIVEEDEEEYEG